jgi:hypothetical protein
MLETHGLPIGVDSPLLQNQYEAFLVWRMNRLWEAIKDATGAVEAFDLEVEEEESA